MQRITCVRWPVKGCYDREAAPADSVNSFAWRSTIAILLSLAATSQAQVLLTVNGSQSQAISPYIYGTNDPTVVPDATFVRLGGNRWTAYNWTNNASNAGSDYLFESDGLLSSSNTPGAAVLPTLQADKATGAATLLTIPTNGYVAADKNHGGDIRYNGNYWNGSTWVSGTYNPNYLAEHFYQEFPNAAANTGNVPNAVYQDQFVNWVNTNAPGQQVVYDLDNEPSAWSSTHLEVHPANATYQELDNDAINYGGAIKAVAPNALVFGAVNYGWQGMVALGNQPADSTINDTILNFQASYLKSLNAASQAAGKRLLDVLDFHWYPEAQGTNGVRITSGTDDTAPTVAARLQAARSLWDPSYVENSWITQYSTPYEPSGSPAQFKTAAIQLLPREQAIINEYNPGTRLSISEYEYGGGSDISGGVAEADVLGVYGEKGVFSAAWWGDGAPNDHYITSAFNMYLNYDGHGHKFGNTSIGASASDVSKASVYASEDAGNPNRMVIVLVNKSTTGSQVAALNFSNVAQFSLADAYQLTSASSNIAHVNLLNSSPLAWTGASSLNYTMPVESVTTLVLVKPQLGDVNLDGQVNGADLQAMLGILKNEGSYESAHNLTDANLVTLGDISHDGKFNAADIAAMETYLANGAAGNGDFAAVPEPNAFCLLLGLNGGWLIFRCDKIRHDTPRVDQARMMTTHLTNFSFDESVKER
ncbi:MAG TPA: glycoside hydrolase family 44 protein [Pirellulales bacterium]|nr:glycoside hydrolase family 44 protein [Pirellulales bacterium]